jgi:hypothetical protein
MNEKQRRTSERGSRVDVFMAANAADFPADGKGDELAASLKAELANLSALDVTKATGMSARQQNSVGRRDLRESLRAQVAAYCDTAEVVGLDHPEVKGSFPRERSDHSDQTLIAVARSFVVKGAPLKQLFVEYNLPADFLDSMGATADALERHMTLQTESKGARVGANASITETLKRVDELVAKLDVIVRNKYRNDPAKLAAWESAHHLERAARAKRSNGTPQTPQTP